jgi:Flp pilus assembly protein TadG
MVRLSDDHSVLAQLDSGDEGHRRVAYRLSGRLRRIASDESGVVAVEFALVLPLILFVLFAIIDFGQVFNNLNDANHIAGMGARYAAVDNKPTSDTLQNYLKSQGDTQNLRDNIGVCIVFPNTTSKIGDPVQVRVTSSFQLVPVLGGANIPLHAEATMRIERPPTTYSAGC